MLIDVFGAQFMRAHLCGRQLNLQPNNATPWRNFCAFHRINIAGQLPVPLWHLDIQQHANPAQLTDASAIAVMTAVSAALGYALNLTGTSQISLLNMR